MFIQHLYYVNITLLFYYLNMTDYAHPSTIFRHDIFPTRYLIHIGGVFCEYVLISGFVCVDKIRITWVRLFFFNFAIGIRYFYPQIHSLKDNSLIF